VEEGAAVVVEEGAAVVVEEGAAVVVLLVEEVVLKTFNILGENE
jgi:hypothetical protein